MKRKNRLILPLLLLSLLASVNGRSQPVHEVEIKAVFIYNFTKFIQWPEESFDPSQETFVIGILGESELGKFLEEAVAGETYKSRPIEVKYFPTLKDVTRCQILYVGESVTRTKFNPGFPVLTVGDRPDFMEQKGIIKFYNEGNKVRFQINESAADAAGLVISSKLLRLATIYHEK
jgi:hypothetical protein